MASFGGYGSADSPRKGKTCPNCKKKGHVSYMGSTVQHGNVFAATADTEVDHHYHCDNCKHIWDEYA